MMCEENVLINYMIGSLERDLKRLQVMYPEEYVSGYVEMGINMIIDNLKLPRERIDIDEVKRVIYEYFGVNKEISEN